MNGRSPRRATRRVLAGCAIAAGLLGVTAPAHAEAVTGLGAPLADSALARVRGGFSGPDGTLVITFGAQRGVSVDAAAPTLAAISGATLIQNALNNQQIRTVTAIDVTVNSLQLYRSLNLQSTLGTAILDSLRR